MGHYICLVLKEYSKNSEIDFVIWAFYEGNDLIDLDRELNTKNFNLKKYLQPNFTQNLKLKQRQVDKY